MLGERGNRHIYNYSAILPIYWDSLSNSMLLTQQGAPPSISGYGREEAQRRVK